MVATNDPTVDRYALPGVSLPVLPDDIANKAYVDAGSPYIKLGTVTLGVAGASLLLDGFSVEMDPPTTLNSCIIGKFNMTGNNAKIISAKINNGTSFEEQSYKVVAGAATFDNPAATTMGISQNTVSSKSGIGNIEIACGSDSTTKTLGYIWNYGMGNGIDVHGAGQLNTTKSTIFTGLEIISSADVEAGSSLSLYLLRK